MTTANPTRQNRKTTERTRRAILNSPRSARHLRHARTGPEHLMLSILADPVTEASRALFKLGITHETFLAHVQQCAGSEGVASNGSLPEPTEQFFRVVARAHERAEVDGKTYTGTTHIVAELIANPDTIVASFFREHGITVEKFRCWASGL